MKAIVLKARHSYLACAVMAVHLLPAWSTTSGQDNAKLKSSIEEMNSKFLNMPESAMSRWRQARSQDVATR